MFPSSLSLSVTTFDLYIPDNLPIYLTTYLLNIPISLYNDLHTLLTNVLQSLLLYFSVLVIWWLCCPGECSVAGGPFKDPRNISCTRRLFCEVKSIFINAIYWIFFLMLVDFWHFWPDRKLWTVTQETFLVKEGYFEK